MQHATHNTILNKVTNASCRWERHITFLNSFSFQRYVIFTAQRPTYKTFSL